MTSAIGVEHSHRRRRFHLHCACGATVVTSDKTAICTACGQPLVFHGRRRHRHTQSWSLALPKQALQELLLILGALILGALVLFVVFNLLGLGWAIIASLLVAGLASALRQQPTPRTGHHPAIPDYEKRYLHLGLLFLLFALFIASIPIISSDAFQERLAVLNTPKPSDCDWGDKHCHYESSVSHFSDQNGEHIIVKWYRVND